MLSTRKVPSPQSKAGPPPLPLLTTSEYTHTATKNATMSPTNSMVFLSDTEGRTDGSPFIAS
jgi:hypothetical protein